MPYLWGMRLILFFALFITSTAMSQVSYPKFDIQGHRGARGLQPENTIPAFLLALDTGVTTIEMDVVVTADKQVVVSHEPWMSAAFCTDPNGKPVTERNEKKFNLYKMTYNEIKQFDCGSRGNDKFPEQKKLAICKPLLSDVIVAVENHIKSFSRYEVDYNIEIKSEKELDGKFNPSPAEFSDRVYQLINEYLPTDRVIIQSFDFRVLAYWHQKYPDVRLAALVDNLKTIDENIKELGFKPAIYSPDYKLLSKDEIRYCHELKMKVIPWTVNDLNEMLELKTWNVDGFITDYPDRAVKYWHTFRSKAN
jgi:glycerophosphoryl diester phosphodiesterase